MPRLLTIMGSGETTATMVPVHRSVLERFDHRPAVVVLDTPYGFQENADELTARAVDYFRTSLPMADVTVASLRDDDVPAGQRERALAAISDADVVFAGPGSPSYALRRWSGGRVPALLADKLVSGGAVTMASAASITVGRWSIPVYEVYKVGEPPHWLDGLDVLGAVGSHPAVVPHFDNAEGGTHDTRFCWMGASRFEALLHMLPPGTPVLWVDEHTACVLDLDAGTLRAEGRGTVTVIRGEERTVLSPGHEADAGLLRSPIGTTPAAPLPAVAAAGQPPHTVEWLTEAFRRAMADDDADAALHAILELEDAHEGWDDAGHTDAAHEALRAMVTRFGIALSDLVGDPAVRRHAVDVLLEVRERARSDRRWDDADAIRHALGHLGIRVEDTPDGTVWEAAGL
jgi:cyanophycinase-like exopeptidase